MIKPEIYHFDKVKEFAEEFQIGEGDLMVTNQYIYEPFFGALNLKCDVIFQEKYGQGEPSDDMVEAMYKDIKGPHKRVIAVGGGTVIDISKLFALKDVSPVLDLYDGKIPPVKDKELVLVPTTCGTGSEVTNIAILALNSRGTKKGLAVDEMYGDSAVLVPELLESLPFGVFATSSIDALVHAVESSLSPKGNQTTRMFGYKAIDMILNGYKEIAAHGPEAEKAASASVSDGEQLCRYRLWQRRLCRSACHELPARGNVSCASRRVQLCDVYRSHEELHGDQDGRRDCNAQPFHCRYSGLLHRECVRGVREAFESSDPEEAVA